MENLTKDSENIVKPIRNEKGQLLPGVVLNPAGKPKGIKHMTTLLEEAIKKVATDTGTTEDIAIVSKVIERAKAGDMKAIEHIWDRMEGKAPQTINVDADIRTDDGLTPEQKEQLLNLLK